MATQETIQDRVTRRVSHALNERGMAGSVADFLTEALEDLSLHSPREVRSVITGDGTDEYSMPDAWSDGFSVVRRAFFVENADYNEPWQELLPEEWALEVDTSDATQIRFLSVTPSSSDEVVLIHTAPHAVTSAAATTTPNARERAALVARTCALICRAAATATTGQTPQGVESDFVGFSGTQGDTYRRLADDYDQEFKDLMGVGAGGAAGTAGSGQPEYASIPATPSYRNRRYLTHPRRGASGEAL